MALPVHPLATGSVTIAGADVPIRSLSRLEVLALSDLDTASAEVFMVARSTGSSDDEARAWLDSVDAPTAGGLLEAIGELSGLKSGKR